MDHCLRRMPPPPNAAANTIDEYTAHIQKDGCIPHPHATITNTMFIQIKIQRSKKCVLALSTFD
jgi:hypothetical protein